MINFDRMRQGISFKGWKMKLVIIANGDYVLAAVDCANVENKEVVWIGINEQDARKAWIEKRDEIMNGIVDGDSSGN